MYAQCLGGVSQMNLENLSDVHTGRNAQGVKAYVKGCTVGQEGHILLRKDSRNNTLVTVTTCHLVTDGDLSLLCDVAADNHVDTGRKLVAVGSCEDLYIDDYTALTVGNSERCVSDFPCLFTEDGSKKSLFGCQLCLTLGCDLTDENVACVYLGAYSDDTSLIEVSQGVLTHIGDISCDVFRTELCVSRLDFVFFDVDRCIHIVAHKALVYKYGVLIVVALPHHKADEGVLTEGDLAL